MELNTDSETSSSVEKTCNSLENGTSDSLSSDEAESRLKNRDSSGDNALVKTKTKKDSDSEEGTKTNNSLMKDKCEVKRNGSVAEDKSGNKGTKKESSGLGADELSGNSEHKNRPEKNCSVSDAQSARKPSDRSSSKDETAKSKAKEAKSVSTPPTIAVKGIRRPPVTGKDSKDTAATGTVIEEKREGKATSADGKEKEERKGARTKLDEKEASKATRTESEGKEASKPTTTIDLTDDSDTFEVSPRPMDGPSMLIYCC